MFRRIKSMFGGTRTEEVVNPVVATPAEKQVSQDTSISRASATYLIQQGRHEAKMLAAHHLSERAKLVRQIEKIDIELEHIRDVLLYVPDVTAVVAPVSEAPIIESDI